MVKSRKNLGLLPHVIQAIADLRESSGTAVRHIVDKVRTNLDGTTAAPKNLVPEIRRALRRGLDTGLLSYHGGKYQMAMDPDEKGFEGGDLVRQHRRRRRSRSYSPYRRRRRRRSRRSRRRRSRSRRRYRRRRRSIHGSSQSPSELSNTTNASGNSNDTKKTSGNEDAGEVDTTGPMAIKGEVNLKKRGHVSPDKKKVKKLKKDREGRVKEKNDGTKLTNQDMGSDLLPKKSLVRVKSRASQGRTAVSRRSRSRKLEEINEQLKNEKMPSRRPSNNTFDERKRDRNDNMEPRDSYLN